MNSLPLSGLLSGRNSSKTVQFRERERASLFFRRGKEVQYIKAGSKFRRLRDSSTEETAKVLSVATDSFGIPHIRYEIEISKLGAQSRFKDGPRVLALKSFIGAYRELVSR